MAAHVAAGATGRTSPHAGDDLTHLSAPELVARYQQGDRHALMELVPRMRESVIGHIAHRLSDPSEVEDLAHDVLAHALAHLEAVDPDRGLWPWLMAMANNRIIDHHRQYDTANTRVDDVRVAETLVPSTRARAEDAFETVELREQRRTLFRMLRHLAPRQRAALVLHAVHGWNADQIAELLGTNRNNVHQLLARARGRARREYLSLTGGHRPWAVVPWPLLWARDRIRRALQRSRDVVTEWQGALPAAGESVTTAASMAVAVAVVASVSVISGGPDAADAAEPPQRAAVSHTAEVAWTSEPVTILGTTGEDRPSSTDVLPRADDTPSRAHVPSPSDPESGDLLDEPGPTVQSPQTNLETGESERYDDGRTLDAEIALAPDEDEDAGGASLDKNCSTASGPVVCDTVDATEGDSAFERTEDKATEAEEITVSTDDTSQTVDESEDDADDWDLLTDDNCGLDDAVETVCESAEDPADAS